MIRKLRKVPASEYDGLVYAEPATVDFRSFRTMHSILMSSVGVRPEVTHDNMGHATVDVMQNVYNRTWWEERVEAVSLAAASVWREFTSGQQPARTMRGSRQSRPDDFNRIRSSGKQRGNS